MEGSFKSQSNVLKTAVHIHVLAKTAETIIPELVDVKISIIGS